jgi:Mrp family chromosome partitioning ATPase
MIQNIQHNGRPVHVHCSERLRVHFLALARRVAGWQRPDGIGGPMSIGVAPVHSRAGASTVAFNLAASLAGITRGNVLYVETSFGQTGGRFRIPRPGYGLSEVLQDLQTPTSCIHPTSVERLYFLGTGRINARGAMELPFEVIENLNAELSNSFEYILYDLPAATDVTHCFPIARQLDAALLVVGAKSVEENRIRRAARRFEEIRTPLIGLVLNKA